ncbi:MAG: LamG domain-containing protein [Deltaproteobacteria bacterium]|nr:LamG domain-containing protein [Deltaproteobacteria bacterium]MBW2081590.1 LamG domain-containing protein [Deltaproteobacteria bacterium]
MALLKQNFPDPPLRSEQLLEWAQRHSSAMTSFMRELGDLVVKLMPKDATPNQAGAYVHGETIGYHDGSQWMCYINDDGTFGFKGDNGNYLTWDGSTLEVKGTLKASAGEIGGFTIGATVLYSTDNNIVLDSANKKITISDITFGNQGIQLDYNSGSPRAYIGDGSNQFFKFDGTKITWKGTNAELTDGGVLSVSDILATGGSIAGWDIDSSKIYKTGIELDATNKRLKAYNSDNYVIISPSGIECYDDTLGITVNIPTDGSAPTFSSGVIKEFEYQIYTSGVIKTADDPTSDGGFLVNNTRLAGYTSAGLKVLEFIFNGDDAGDAYIGDFDNDNAGLKYDHSAGTLDIRATLSLDSYYKFPDDADLIAAWDFDIYEDVGLVPDISGNKNNLAFNDKCTVDSFVQGVAGRALEALEADGNVKIANSDMSQDLYNLGSADFSVSWWMKIKNSNPSTNYPKVLYKFKDNDNRFHIHPSSPFDGDIRLVIREDGNYDSKTVAASYGDWQWHHYAYCFDVSEKTVYIYEDGEPLTTWTWTNCGNDISNTGNLGIAGNPGGADPLNGCIDCFRIYKKVLTADEVKALYLNPAGYPVGYGMSLADYWAHNSDRTLIDGSKIYAGSITTDKLDVNELSAITANLGNINAGNITGVNITGATIRTASTGDKRIEITSDGIALMPDGAAGQYGNNFKYGNNVKYGAGVLAYINHLSKDIPFYINYEQNVADFHFYNRSSTPSGTAEIGDVCVVNGVLKICTAAGTPGTWEDVRFVIDDDDRDPSSHDFVLGDLTTDGNFHELDLSGIVPTGARFVALGVRVKAPATYKYIQFKPRDNTNNYAVHIVYTTEADVPNYGYVVVRLDSNRKIYYKTVNYANWTFIYIDVMQWFY